MNLQYFILAIIVLVLLLAQQVTSTSQIGGQVSSAYCKRKGCSWNRGRCTCPKPKPPPKPASSSPTPAQIKAHFEAMKKTCAAAQKDPWWKTHSWSLRMVCNGLGYPLQR